MYTCEAAAKAGILGLTRSPALELAADSVRVNAVAPGRIATPRVRANYSDAEWEAAAYLSCDAAKHMTGQPSM